jgi:hypothetical protein
MGNSSEIEMKHEKEIGSIVQRFPLPTAKKEP